MPPCSTGFVTDAIGAFVFSLVIPAGVFGVSFIESLKDVIVGVPLLFFVGGLKADVSGLQDTSPPMVAAPGSASTVLVAGNGGSSRTYPCWKGEHIRAAFERLKQHIAGVSVQTLVIASSFVSVHEDTWDIAADKDGASASAEEEHSRVHQCSSPLQGQEDGSWHLCCWRGTTSPGGICIACRELTEADQAANRPDDHKF